MRLGFLGTGEITAAMSIIFAPAVAGRTLAYAPRGPVCDPYDTETIAALMREAAPALKKHRAFLLRFDPETPYTDELIAKYEKLGLRCRARNPGRVKTRELLLQAPPA